MVQELAGILLHQGQKAYEAAFEKVVHYQADAAYLGQRLGQFHQGVAREQSFKAFKELETAYIHCQAARGEDPPALYKIGQDSDNYQEKPDGRQKIPEDYGALQEESGQTRGRNQTRTQLGQPGAQKMGGLVSHKGAPGTQYSQAGEQDESGGQVPATGYLPFFLGFGPSLGSRLLGTVLVGVFRHNLVFPGR